MKQRRITKTCIFTWIYLHGWYVPFFLVLIFVKLFLLSLIANAIKQNNSINNLSSPYSPLVNDNKQYIRKRKSAHISWNSMEIGKLSKFSNSLNYNGIQEKTIIPTPASSKDNEVARIPEDLIDLEINPSAKNRTSPSSIWLIYNSVPKCGEQVTAELIESLAIRNGFAHQEHEYQTPWPRFLLEQEQHSLVEWFQYQHLPKSYHRHFFYVNFTKFQKFAKEKPIYINIVRDPIDRLVLDYYSRRNKSSSITQQEIEQRNALKPGSGTEWYHRTFEECVLQADPECRYTAGEKSFTLMIPFFCGQHNSCVVINDRWALQMAKFNIENEYTVVGVLEEMDQTLTALDKFLPRFFTGAAQLYNEFGFGISHKKAEVKVSSYIRQLMESELYNEVELYRFILRRLVLQASKVSHENSHEAQGKVD